MINANIIIGKYVDRKGFASVMLQVSIDRKVKRYKLFKALPADFDMKRQQMKGNHNRENAIINETLSKINNINLQLQQQGQKATFTTFEHLMEYNGGVVTFDNVVQTYEPTELTLAAVKRFRRMFPDVEFSKVTENIAATFAETLKRQGVRPASVHVYVKSLSSIYNKAIRRGDYSANPFANVQTTNRNREREYLTEDELRRLESLKNLTRPQQRTLDIFLFQCYTGLRKSDVKRLRWSDIQDGAVILRQQKTQNTVFIPLSSRARAVLERQTADRSTIFDVKTAYNISIATIMQLAGIDKHITSHCGRHTFAVLSLNRRIPIEVVSKLLGHTRLQTTQIYAKVANPLIRDYMKLWESD